MFGDGAFKEVIKVKLGYQGSLSNKTGVLIRKEVIRGVHSEKRPDEDK